LCIFIFVSTFCSRSSVTGRFDDKPDRLFVFVCLFTNDKGRLASLACHTVHQTLKSLSNSVNTKARKYDIKIARPTLILTRYFADITIR